MPLSPPFQLNSPEKRETTITFTVPCPLNDYITSFARKKNLKKGAVLRALFIRGVEDLIEREDSK